MYLCRCYTCEAEHLLERLESAQSMFTDHAERQHEVEIQRVESPLKERVEADGALTVSGGPAQNAEEAGADSCER